MSDEKTLTTKILTTGDLMEAAMRSSFEDGRVVLPEPFVWLQETLWLFEKTVWALWLHDFLIGEERGWEAGIDGLHVLSLRSAGRILVTFRETPEADEYLSVIGAEEDKTLSLQGLRMTSAKAVALIDLASDPALRDAFRIRRDVSIG